MEEYVYIGPMLQRDGQSVELTDDYRSGRFVDDPRECSNAPKAAQAPRAGGIEVVVRGRTLVIYAVPTCAAEVAERFMDAGRTLMLTALSTGDLPARVRSAMPEVPSRFREYGWHEVRVRPMPPTREEVGRMNEAIVWLLALEGESRSIVWLHYWRGVPLREIAGLVRVRSPQTIINRAERACGQILSRLKNRSGQNGQKTAA